jgi:Flp pilus assembly protein TadB
MYFFVLATKQRSTNNTMAKTKKYSQYNGQNKEAQTIQWPKQRNTDNTMAKTNVCSFLLWPLYCLYFFVLAIVLFVLLCFGHCIVCTSVQTIQWQKKKQKQTIQWPKQRRTNNTMAKTKKCKQYNGQDKEVCTSLSWPLYCLHFFVLAIVLFVLLCFGHCIVCFLFCSGHCIVISSLLWPKQRSTNNTMAKTKKYKQYNGQSKEEITIQWPEQNKKQTIQWPKQRSTNNAMAKTKRNRQYNGQNKEVQTFFVLAIVLFVLLCFGHCIVCSSLFWPLY